MENFLPTHGNGLRWDSMPSQTIRDGDSDRARPTRVRVAVLRQAPTRVELDPDIRQPAVVEDPTPQYPFSRSFRAECRQQDERDRPARARQSDTGAEHGAGHGEATFDRLVTAVGNEPSCQCRQA